MVTPVSTMCFDSPPTRRKLSTSSPESFAGKVLHSYATVFSITFYRGITMRRVVILIAAITLVPCLNASADTVTKGLNTTQNAVDKTNDQVAAAQNRANQANALAKGDLTAAQQQAAKSQQAGKVDNAVAKANAQQAQASQNAATVGAAANALAKTGH